MTDEVKIGSFQTLLYLLSYSILADADEIRTHDTCNPIWQSGKRLTATVACDGEWELSNCDVPNESFSYASKSVRCRLMGFDVVDGL